MKWSKWVKLAKENLEKVHEKSGVYKIRYPRRIHRLIGIDRDGILMIGESENLKNRINEFFKAINKGGYHSEGFRFYNQRLEKVFPIKKLQFRFKITKNKGKAKESEHRLLKKYQDKYGELPPLNNAGGR